ncbi:transcription factor Adf-1-like [Bufo gargarizans]|uniref:transcription factor Adf-1-like n=1 Tax=Bufo gargarizans TaxID=30331 RepID=UPI001CF15B06|nr:transcription factor Adf-1-like [Bufo gargarizans]
MKSSRLIVDTDLLISEVKKRPAVYDQQEDTYSDRSKKQQCWDEICAILVPGWEESSQLEKSCKAKEIQTRWRSLKDCFRRELHLQKKEARNGSSPSKRKRYMFYDQLTFLESTLMRRSTSGKTSDTQESPKSEGSDSEPPQSPLPERVSQIPEPPRTKRSKSGGSGFGDFESQIIGMVDSLKKKNDNEKDEDYLFVQSLLPYLKKVPEEKKIDLQIDILQLVKTYMQPSGSTPLME